MKTLYLGLKITDAQFEQLQKASKGKDAIQLCIPFIDEGRMELCGRVFSHEDLVYGGITEYGKVPLAFGFAEGFGKVKGLGK